MYGLKSEYSVNLLVLICSVLATALFPAVATLCGIVYLFRWFIGNIARTFLKIQILSTRSALFGADDIYKEPQSALILSVLLQGPVDVGHILNELKYRVLDPNSPVGGFQNPELKMYLTSWMGFLFWQPEENFKVEDHLEVFDDLAQVGLSELGEITGDNFNTVANRIGLQTKPFKRKKSPWELMVFRPSNRTGNGFLILRFHHALADGFSLLKRFVAMNGLPFQFDDPNSKSGSQVSRIRKFFFYLIFPIVAPYQLIRHKLAARDVNEWHLPVEKLTNKVISGNTPSFSTEYIKSVRRVQKCSFTTIILAAMTGGMRKYMIENQIKVPDRFHCMTVLPMPGHPEKLRNHMSACFVKLPLGVSDPIERVRLISEDIEKLKRSTFPLTLFCMFKVIGGLFTRIAQILRKNDFATAILSNIPGPAEGNMELFGHKCQEIGFTGGLHGCNIGLSFTCVSLSGRIRIAAHIDTALVPSQRMMNDLMDKIMEEFDLLGKDSNV